MAKRKRVYASSKRKTKKSKRSFKKKGSKTSTWSSNDTKPRNPDQYRSKKTSRRKYKNKIWNDGMLKAHYRSCLSTGSVIATPNNITGVTVGIFPALPNTAGAAFYTSTGGLRAIDVGVAASTAGREVAIRGGLIRITIANPTPDNVAGGSESIRAKVWLVFANSNPDFGVIPIADSSQLWDPSVQADFNKFGKIVLSREMDLPPNNSAMDIQHRLKVQLVDRGIFETPVQGKQLFWIVAVGQLTATEGIATAESLTVVTSHNLTLTMDQV